MPHLFPCSHTIMQLFEWLVPPLLRLVTKDCKHPVVMQDINMVQSLVRLYESLLKPLIHPAPPPHGSGPSHAAAAAMQVADPEALIECGFLFSLIWSVGGTVDTTGRQLVSDNLRAFLKGGLRGWAWS